MIGERHKRTRLTSTFDYFSFSFFSNAISISPCLRIRKDTKKKGECLTIGQSDTAFIPMTDVQQTGDGGGRGRVWDEGNDDKAADSPSKNTMK